MSSKVNVTFIAALVRRDLWRYFTNPTGYVFITLFIFLSAAAAFWQDRFFLNNLANLGQLNAVFPILMLFFIPALTMSVWAEEKKQSTDELLLTLPATSLEVVLGKYLAALGIYTASLLLSLSHVLVLFWLGSPDVGLMLGNYVGYWLSGAALLAAGLVASQLTANATIAFVTGAAFCSGFVFIESLFRSLRAMGIYEHFADFSKGVVSFAGLFYFVSLTGALLYINVLLVEQRHWPRQADGYPMWVHKSVRAAAVLVALVSLNVMLGRSDFRIDVTAEGLHSLSPDTYGLIDGLSEDRPVFVQAYLSPEVPERYVQTRENILGVIDEISSIAGSRLQVLVQDTEPFTEAAREAREKFGITPRQVPNLSSARAGFSDIFMGIAITSGAREQVIPFLDRGLSAEYEITRGIRVVSQTERRKIGVLTTQVRMFGGFDFQSMRSTPEWPVVQELKNQYQVVQVAADSPLPEDLDALLIPLPSSLTQAQMDNVLPFIEGGRPALLLIDPLPLFNLGLAPSEQAGANVNPFMRSGPPPEQKGDIRAFVNRLGIAWDPAGIVWDSYNPHPDLASLPPELVFIGQGNENPEAYNLEHPATRELQEIVLMYPGSITALGGGSLEFVPLLKTGLASGTLSYPQIVQRNFLGASLNRNLPHRPDQRDYTLAVHIRGTLPAETTQNEGVRTGSSSEEAGTDPATAPAAGSVNVIAIADLDFITEQFFQIRAQGPENLNFDNVTFFLNCIDMLIGDESFISLRSKRVRHRTLERVEDQTRQFIEERVREEGEAEAEAEKALQEAQGRLTERVNQVRSRTDLDAQTKQIMARNLQEVENRRLEVLKANIEAEKNARIAASKENMEAKIRDIQDNIRTMAVLLPPIPVFVLGVVIFVRRQKREREGAAALRRLREQ